MKRTLFIALIALVALLPGAQARRWTPKNPGASSPSLVAHTIAGSADTNGITTSGITTTGANLIVISCAWYNLTTNEVTISDSLGNTWTALTSSVQSNVKERFYYCVSPSVGAGHTFTATGTASFPAISVQAWSNMSVSSPFDQQGGVGTSGSTAGGAAMSITPSQANTVVITGVSFGNSRTISSINGGYSISDSIADASGQHLGGGMAYLILTSASAQAPTWTLSGTSPASARIASFKY